MFTKIAKIVLAIICFHFFYVLYIGSCYSTLKNCRKTIFFYFNSRQIKTKLDKSGQPLPSVQI